MAINVLDKHTANLIAAGEVVERPASAIKEMLENSADAGASRITVEIKNGGSSYFRVTDDGCGMSAEDLPKSVLRHATSKISCPDDLSAIATYGFRGEALAAIAAVCELRILTKRREDTFGSVLHIDGGKVIENGEAGCPDGTTIAASDIFKNLPARRKFLKKDITEANACLAVTEKFALSRPDIAVTFLSDGNIKLKTSGDGKLQNTIYSCLGKDFAARLIAVDYALDGITISGFIGKPETARPGRSLQNFFVNGRYVRSGTMCAALEEAFRAFCPVGKYPAAVLFCSLDFSRVDVNIHPSKTEVKFTEDKKVFEAVLFAVKTALNKGAAFHGSPSSSSFFASAPHSAGKLSQKQLAEVFGIGEVPRQSTTQLAELHARSAEGQFDGIEAMLGLEKPQKDQNSSLSNSAHDSQYEELAKKMVRTANIFDDMPTSSSNEGDISTAYNTSNSPVNSSSAAPDFTKAFSEDSEGVLDVSVKEDTSPTFVRSSVNAQSMDIYTPSDFKSYFEPEQSAEKQDQLSFELPSDETDNVNFKIIGQCFDSFILVERDEVLYIIDKHAAHERILYEEFKSSVSSAQAQLLLEPIRISMSTQEASALIENKDYFAKTGFDFDIIGTSSIIVRAYPSHISSDCVADVFYTLATKLLEGNGRAADDLFDKALFSAACKAAVKAGQKSSVFHDSYIAQKIFSSEAILYCPHGRPVITEFSKEKLYKMFKRT